MRTKRCPSCKIIKNDCDFYKDKSRKDGLGSTCKSCAGEYYRKNAGKRKEYKREYDRKKRATNIEYRIVSNLRTRIRQAVRRGDKADRTIKLIGCEIEYLKNYLASKFSDGMSWDNYGKWHIDHIIPCASFDLTKEEEQRKCFNYKNMQPLWAKENLLKSDNVII